MIISILSLGTSLLSRCGYIKMDHDIDDMCYDSESSGSDDQSADEGIEASKSKRKCKGSTTYKTRYDNSWKKKYPCIQSVKNDPFSFMCIPCGRKVLCKHMGIGDVKRHVQGSNHKKAAKNMAQQSQLSFVSTNDPIKKKVYNYTSKYTSSVSILM